MRTSVIIAAGIALLGAGCTNPPTEAQTAQLVAAGQTLAVVAASNNTTVASIVNGGGLFCKKVTMSTPLVVALADIYGFPVSVTDKSAAAVADACKLVGGIPVAPPVDPASTVVVPADVTMLPKV